MIQTVKTEEIVQLWLGQLVQSQCEHWTVISSQTAPAPPPAQDDEMDAHDASPSNILSPAVAKAEAEVWFSLSRETACWLMNLSLQMIRKPLCVHTSHISLILLQALTLTLPLAVIATNLIGNEQSTHFKLVFGRI